MGCNNFKLKKSLTHYWQGASGGVNTKNADRISGLYDLDLCYLLSANRCDSNLGDYLLLVVSSQMSFGNGINDSKVQSFFDINNGVKGYNDIYVDKLYAEFTAMDRVFTFNAGKISMTDYVDGSAVAADYKTQFFAKPLYRTGNIPYHGKGLGARAQYQPEESWYIQAAIIDGRAAKREIGFRTAFHGESDFLTIAEFGIRPKLFDKDGTYRFMVWYDKQEISYLDNSGQSKSDNTGFAVSFDQKLTEKFTTFFRYGWANGKINEVEDFISFGGQIKAPFEGREDVFAVGYANGLRSPDGLSSDDKRQINLIESYYGIKINKNMILSPNIQIVMNPGGKKSESPATILGLRCRIKF